MRRGRVDILEDGRVRLTRCNSLSSRVLVRDSKIQIYLQNLNKEIIFKKYENEDFNDVSSQPESDEPRTHTISPAEL